MNLKLASALLIFLAGCATTPAPQHWFYNHNYPQSTQQARFNNDQGYCNAISHGHYPEPPPYIPQLAGATHMSGMVHGPGGYVGTFQGQSYEHNPVAEMGAMVGMMSSLRREREAAARRVVIAERCMMNLGWFEVSGPYYTPPEGGVGLVDQEEQTPSREVSWLIQQAEDSVADESWVFAVHYAEEALKGLEQSPGINDDIVYLGQISAILWHANMMRGEYQEALLAAGRGAGYATRYFGPRSRPGAMHLEMMGDAWLAMGKGQDAEEAYRAALETKELAGEKDVARIQGKIHGLNR